ncbi:MAG: PQQ-binding-like beta-propeller repeat protein [Candidatus Cloacimonetes bacterium]|nr:PQQ-binding-like beta-propeller repeat protein [Candidatus Cloacimonadota bacterium]
MVKLIVFIGFLLLNGCGGGGSGGTYNIVDSTVVPGVPVVTRPIVISSPAYDGSQIVVGSPDSVVYSLNVSGSILWQFNTGSSVDSSPAISDDGTIYVGSNDQKLYALNGNGSEKWSFQTNGAVKSSASISKNGNVYVSSEDGFLYSVNAIGTENWKYNLGSASSSSPVVYSTTVVFVGSDNSKVSAISTTGTLLWDFDTTSAVKSSVAMDVDSNIYIGTEDGTVYSLSFSGSQNWSFKAGDSVRGQISIDASGNVVFGSKDGFIYSLSKAGVLNWKQSSNGEVYSTIAIDSNDQLYYGNTSGILETRSQAGAIVKTASIGEKLYSSVKLLNTTGAYIGSYDNKYSFAMDQSLIKSIIPFSDFRNGLKNPGRMDCSTTQDIVASFTRFGLSNWGPDPSGVLESKDNQSFSGIYSPNTLEDYDFEAELYSPDTDDDTIALIVASHRDNSNNFHALIATRGGAKIGGAIGNIYWGLVYIQLDAGDNIVNQAVIVNSEATLADGLGSWSNFSGGTRIRLTRRKNIITAETSLKTNTSFSNYVNLATINFDLTSDANTTRFVGPQSIGFAAHSQANARFRRININGVAACKSI